MELVALDKYGRFLEKKTFKYLHLSTLDEKNKEFGIN